MSTSSVTAASPGLIQPVANWSTKGKEVSVFQENDRLKYTLTSDSVIETGNISLSLYDTPKHRSLALKFIKIFQCALLGNNSREHCFLPIFYAIHKRPSPASNSVLALFARVIRAGNGNKEVLEAKWGIWEAGNVSWLEVEDAHTREFLVGAPSYRDKMDIYCQHFKEVITLDPDNRVQSIALRCVSGLNRDIFLDENTCAITLISAQKRGGFAGFFKLGHGSIAWEGIEAGSYFLKWADLTSDHPDSKGEYFPDQARIRIVDREIPSESWLVGPTCSRTKELTDKMVAYLSRDVVVKDDTRWSSFVNFSLIAPLRNLFKKTGELERERRSLAAVENCLSLAVSALQRAEIFLPEPGRGIHHIEPNGYLISLHSDYIAENQDSYIVFKHKESSGSYDETDARIIMHLLANVEDAVNDLVVSVVSEEEASQS